MTITRLAPARRPFGEATLLQHRLNSIFDELGWQPEVPQSSFVPAVDVYEDAQRVVVKIEVPGIKQDDLDVRLEGRTLTVKGERRFENEDQKANYHRIERSYGSFTRTFTVPQTVETESVKANYDAGVLTVSLAKKAEAKAKQVAIEAGPAAVQAFAAQPVASETAAATAKVEAK